MRGRVDAADLPAAQGITGDGGDRLDMGGNRGNPDVAVGGGGSDTAAYADRSGVGVRVTIDGVADDGDFVRLQSEGDDVRPDVEILTGSRAADALTGSAGGNIVLGSSGADTYRGGGGADLLSSADGVTDKVIACEDPASVEFGDVADIDLVDPAPTGCETVNRAAKDQFPTVHVRGGVVRVRAGRASVRVRCPRAVPGGRCGGVLRIVTRRRAVGAKPYELRAGEARTLRVRIAGRRRGRGEIRTTERDTSGRPESTATPIRLR